MYDPGNIPWEVATFSPYIAYFLICHKRIGGDSETYLVQLDCGEDSRLARSVIALSS